MDSRDCNGETNVSLLIKVPDQQMDDQTVECTLDWSIGRLKDHLTEVYPSKPKRDQQRIIFLGQLLNDSVVLKDVLHPEYSKDGSPFVIHLVCQNQAKVTSAKKQADDSTLRRRHINETPIVNQPPRFVLVPSESVHPTQVQQYYSQLRSEQMAWVQQAYTRYLNRYMQIIASQGVQVESDLLYMQHPDVNESASDVPNNNNSSTVFNNNNNNNNNNNIEENEMAQDPVFGRVQDALGGQQRVIGDADVANIHRAPADEMAAGAGRNRDWLDIFDMLLRIIVLSSIVYFYSSPPRFLIVTFVGFAIYLIQSGFFRVQRAFLGENNPRVVENNNEARQNAVVRPEEIINRIQPIPEMPIISPEAQQEEETRTNLNEENDRPGPLAFTWTFFSSFFTSLIPDQPHVI